MYPHQNVAGTEPSFSSSAVQQATMLLSADTIRPLSAAKEAPSSIGGTTCDCTMPLLLRTSECEIPVKAQEGHAWKPEESAQVLNV